MAISPGKLKPPRKLRSSWSLTRGAMRCRCHSGDWSSRSNLDLVLGEVTDHEAFIEVRRACKRFELARDRLDQRRLARTVDAEQPVALAALQREPDVAHDSLAWAAGQDIARVDVFEHQQRIGCAQRLAEFELERRGDVQRRELLHL